MSMSTKSLKIRKRKREKNTLNKKDLINLSREELIEKIIKLDAHNSQLQHIIQKQNKRASNELATKNKKIDFSKVSKRHVFLKFYYFGWDYQGYVVQEDTINTIEYYLFKALQKCCLIENRETSNYHRCGRTDKGVSAFSQVISIDLRSKLPNPNEENTHLEYPYCFMLNRLLPDNIRCYSWCHVPQAVSSRFDCTWRTYKYYFPKGNLNIEAMREGAKYLVGTKDFRNFCKMDVGNGIIEFEREIQSSEILKYSSDGQESSGYEMYVFVIRGRGFLWHQIRCIMSILLLIGQGKENPNVIDKLFDITENPTKPQYFMANYLPLNLYAVAYDNLSINWVTDEGDLTKTLKLLQAQWTSHAVRCTMTKDVIAGLNDLRKNSTDVFDEQSESLLDGVKSKVYKPLLSRMKCESLENKIDRYVKKKKLEIIENRGEENKETLQNEKVSS